MWGKLYKNGPGSARSKWGISVELPGLATQELVERSIREYLGGETNEESTGTGTGSHLANFGEFIPYTQAEPMLVDIFVHLKKKVVACAAGYNFSAFITSDGLLYTVHSLR